MSNRNRNYRNQPPSRQSGRDDFEHSRAGSRDWEGPEEDQRHHGPQGRGYAMPDYGGPHRDDYSYSRGQRFAESPRGGHRRSYEDDYGGGYQNPSYRAGEGRFRGAYEQNRYPGSGYGQEFGGRSDDGWESRLSRSWRELYGQGSSSWDLPNDSGYGQSYGSRGAHGAYGDRGQQRLDSQNYGQDAWGDRRGDDQRAPQRGREEQEPWGEQLRDAGKRVLRGVKRAFRGPKGYKRSDDRIREDVCDRLAQQSDFDPSDIEVSVANGEVTLSGNVQNRQEKFYAEEIADDVSGVADVHNRLRVRREEAPASGVSAAPTGGAAGQNAQRNRNARA